MKFILLIIIIPLLSGYIGSEIVLWKNNLNHQNNLLEMLKGEINTTKKSLELIKEADDDHIATYSNLDMIPNYRWKSINSDDLEFIKSCDKTQNINSYYEKLDIFRGSISFVDETLVNYGISGQLDNLKNIIKQDMIKEEIINSALDSIFNCKNKSYLDLI